MYYNNTKIFDDEVNFDGIESYHRFDDKNIICPKGKFHPIYYYEGGNSSLIPTYFTDNGDWELKCLTHEQGYFMVFYLMNGESNLFYKKSGESNWSFMKLNQEIYGVKSTSNDIGNN